MIKAELKKGSKQGRSGGVGVGAVEQGVAAGEEKSHETFHYLQHIRHSSAHPPRYADPHQQLLPSHGILA